MLVQRGVKPGSLPPSEDVKKVRRRLDKEEKKVLTDVKKTRPKQVKAKTNKKK
jgi:DNA-damage-inducible protein D